MLTCTDVAGLVWCRNNFNSFDRHRQRRLCCMFLERRRVTNPHRTQACNKSPQSFFRFSKTQIDCQAQRSAFDVQNNQSCLYTSTMPVGLPAQASPIAFLPYPLPFCLTILHNLSSTATQAYKPDCSVDDLTFSLAFLSFEEFCLEKCET